MLTCSHKELGCRAEPSDLRGKASLSCSQVFLPGAQFGAPAVELGQEGGKSRRAHARLRAFNVVAQRFRRRPVMAALSRQFPSMCLASKVSLQRRRGSGSIKLQLVFCNGLRADVQQNQLSGQRRGAGTMANTYKRSGSKPIKIRSVQRSVSI